MIKTKYFSIFLNRFLDKLKIFWSIFLKIRINREDPKFTIIIDTKTLLKKEKQTCLKNELNETIFIYYFLNMHKEVNYKY